MAHDIPLFCVQLQISVHGGGSESLILSNHLSVDFCFLEVFVRFSLCLVTCCIKHALFVFCVYTCSTLLAFSIW